MGKDLSNANTLIRSLTLRNIILFAATSLDLANLKLFCCPLQTNYNVPGGRISPSVSEADLRNPVESLKGEVSWPTFYHHIKSL